MVKEFPRATQRHSAAHPWHCAEDGDSDRTFPSQILSLLQKIIPGEKDEHVNIIL